MKKMMLAVAAVLAVSGTVRAEVDLRAAFTNSYAAEATKDYAGAVKALRAAEMENGRDYLVNLRMGWLQYALGKWTESIDYYRAAAEAAPTAVEPLLGLMQPLAAAQKWIELSQTRQAILKLDPGNYKALSGEAWAWYAAKDYPTSAKYYTKLTKLYPSDVEMLLGLGYALKMAGDKDGAAATFNRVLLLSPKNTRALEGLK